MKSDHTTTVYLYTRHAHRKHPRSVLPTGPSALVALFASATSAFMLTHGPKRGWKRLPYSACSAVAEGEQYWQVLVVTHTVSDLRLVKEALLQAG